MIQFKYIGQDPQKQGWIAKARGLHNMYCDVRCEGKFSIEGQAIPIELFQNSDDREEIKEDVFEKIWYDGIENETQGGIATVYKNNMLNSIKKHLGITEEEIEKITPYHSGKIYTEDIKDLLKSKGLLIGKNNGDD